MTVIKLDFHLQNPLLPVNQNVISSIRISATLVTMMWVGNPAQGQEAVVTTLTREHAKSNDDGLNNLMRVSDRILSGSEPHGDDGFRILYRLGIKTVVSVDGLKPNTASAAKYGLRYVHIPIGYDGIPKEAGEMLARLVRDAEGPFYIHCHHGKHRGPAAAAIACVASGALDGKESLRILERGGTNRNYAGLWRDVEAYTPPPEDAELPVLVEVAKVSSFAHEMAQIDRTYDNLKLFRKSAWGTLSEHPDLVPIQEALLLKDRLQEAGRMMSTKDDKQFRLLLAEAESCATRLLAGLKAEDSAQADKWFGQLEQSCRRCHANYRDR